MLNGLLFLYRDKNRMSGLVYRFLHSVLTDEGVNTQGMARHDWMAVMEAIEIRTGLDIEVFIGEEVAQAFSTVDFNRQVVVCDIDSGTHSILLSGRRNGWLEGFDPDWHNIKIKRERAGSYIVRPYDSRKRLRDRTNVLINEEYLLKSGRGKKGEFQMGAVASRNLVVMRR